MNSKSTSSASIKSTKGSASSPDRPGWMPQSSCVEESREKPDGVNSVTYHYIFSFEFEHYAAAADLLTCSTEKEKVKNIVEIEGFGNLQRPNREDIAFLGWDEGICLTFYRHFGIFYRKTEEKTRLFANNC